MTWSKGFSLVTDQYPGARLMQLDPNPAVAYSFSWAYDLPFGKGKQFLNGSPRAVNAVAGVSPYLVTSPGDFTPTSKYLNVAAFTTSTGFNFGNLAPNLSWVRGFWSKQEALTIGRAFRLTEKFKLDLSADATNPFNFHRWNNPNTTLTSAAFGTVVGTADGRTLQMNMAVKF